MTLVWDVNEMYYGTLDAAYAGEPSAALKNLNLVAKKINDPDCQDRDTLSKYILKIMKFIGKSAIDSSSDSGRRLNELVGFLRFLEGLVRGHGLPSNLINAGRNLRVELIIALQSECEKRSDADWKSISKETLDELIHLFTELTPAPDPDSHEDETVAVLRHRYSCRVTVGGRAMSTLSWDDVELVYLFGPILQHLNAIMINNVELYGDYLNTLPDYLEFRRQVEELKLIFAKFKATVPSGAREIKRRNRDPDLRWCYYYE
ncbi:hypothetical protein FRC00_010076 [Tulasnella sp. 408]|nr:hypothetical protein FRC00_010076 [Tulasnella sp. 408]